jgi:hypothetical protein
VLVLFADILRGSCHRDVSRAVHYIEEFKDIEEFKANPATRWA